MSGGATRRWRAAHPEAARARGRADQARAYKRDPEKFRARMRLFRQAKKQAESSAERETRLAKKSAAQREWRRADPEGTLDRRLKRRYGISRKERDALLVDQDGCAICGVAEAPDRIGWVVDHCHRTGKIRGVLCNPCNVALGRAKDDPSCLDLMAQYIRHHA